MFLFRNEIKGKQGLEFDFFCINADAANAAFENRINPFCSLLLPSIFKSPDVLTHKLLITTNGSVELGFLPIHRHQPDRID